MKIVNVKTPVIEILFHHRDSENTEKTGRVVFAFPGLTIRLKTNIKQMRAVRKIEIGRVSFSNKLRK